MSKEIKRLKNNHGGARTGAGRPKKEQTKQVRLTEEEHKLILDFRLEKKAEKKIEYFTCAEGENIYCSKCSWSGYGMDIKEKDGKAVCPVCDSYRIDTYIEDQCDDDWG